MSGDLTFCAYCGRTGVRGFQLRHGDGVTPQTGDWQCSSRTACQRRQAAAAQRDNDRRTPDECTCDCGVHYPDNPDCPVAERYVMRDHSRPLTT